MISPITTADGSLTLYSSRFDENYHSLMGAREESLKKFIEPSGIFELSGPIRILDVGFGLGYNTLTFMEEAQKLNRSYEIDALELFPETLQAALDLHGPENRAVLSSLLHSGRLQGQNGTVRIFFGDARENLSCLKAGFYHCVFLDPFSPPKNPELWTVQTFQKLSALLSDEGKIVTYSSSLSVVSALRKAGFFVGYTPPAGRKRGGLLAAKKKGAIVFPLSEKDEFMLAVSFHALPNSEKKGSSPEAIRQYRQKLSGFSKDRKFLLPHKRCLKIFDSLA